MVAKLAPLALAILAALTLTEPALIDEVVEADLDAVAYVRSPREGAPTSATLLLRALPRLAGALNVSVSSPTAPAGWQQRSVAVVPGGGTMAVAPVSRLTILLAGWPDGDHVVTLSAFHPPHVVNSSMVRWLRVATTPPPPQPPATLYIEPGLTIPMVDQHWLASSSGLRRHTEQPPLLPITNASFGTELGYVPYETLLSLAATRDGNGVAARFTLNNDGNRSAPERIVSCHSDATGDHWSCEYESPAAVHLAFKLRTRASDQPPVNPFDACKSCRLYNNQTDGPVNLSHIIIGWPWAPYNCSGCGMTLPMRTAWPALLRPESGACLLLRDTPLNGYNTTRLAAMQAGKIPGSFADSGDNFGGAYLMPGGKRYVLLQERLIARFPPLRVAYDNLNGLTRTNVAWTTTDGIEWTPSFAMPEPRAQCTRADVLPGEANCSLYGWQQYGTVAPGLPGHGQPQLWQEKGSLLLGYVQDFGSGIARYHLSLMSSRDGLFWQRVSDPAHGHTGVPTINSTADGVMVPNGAFHSWDGGLTAPPAYTGSELQSVGGSVTVGEYMFEPMNFVSNRAHFIVETRHADFWQNASMRSPSALKAWFSARNPGLESWPDWGRLGGWEGLSKDLLSPPAETFQIRVGVTRRRLNRWAYLQDGGGGGGGNAAERSGTLTTRAAMATARTELALNADISAGGSIRVEALGREWLLQGPRDGIQMLLQPGPGLVVEEGQAVSVNLTLSGAKLYGLNWM